MWNEIKNIKSGRKEVAEFALTIALAYLIIISLAALFRGTTPRIGGILAAISFIVAGRIFPALLIPLQKTWMALAIVMGFFMSRLVLGLIFYGVVTPIAIIARLGEKDILDERIDKERRSYWTERAQGKKSQASYEKQF